MTFFARPQHFVKHQMESVPQRIGGDEGGRRGIDVFVGLVEFEIARRADNKAILREILLLIVIASVAGGGFASTPLTPEVSSPVS